jgi:hypothetical protein
MNNYIGFGLMLLGAIVFFVWQNILSKRAAAKAAKDLIDTKARNDAAWLIDYHNPVSVNYDPARVGQELAAAEAAWALDEHNPASVNYDPNA